MASRWCTPTFCHQLFGHIHWYVRHPLVWECCKPFKRKQHKDTLGNNIKGLYEHSMWNCWCLACVEASRLGVLEATIFPTLQGNFAYAAKTWYQVTCQWYSDTYIYIYICWYILIRYSNDISTVSSISFFVNPKTLGVESVQVSALWDERCAIVGWFCHCFVASVFRRKKHICSYGSKTPVMDVSYTEPHVWFMITLFKTIVLWFFYTFPMGFPWKKTGKGF